MEWVETTGKTVAEALEAALDRLGVAESDAEVVVVEEPKSAMFGLRKSSARIRVRVKPVQARAKRPSRRPSGAAGDSRGARRSPGRPGGSGRGDGDSAGSRDDSAGREDGSGEGDSRGTRSGGSDSRPPRRSGKGSRDGQRGGNSPDSTVRGATRDGVTRDGVTRDGVTRDGIVGASGGSANSRSRRSKSRTNGGAAGAERPRSSGSEDRQSGASNAPKEEEMSIEAQAEAAESFVRGVVGCFGVEATVESKVVDDVIEIAVLGSGLGLLVGPKGVTVEALQELTRTAVQHRSDEHTGRIHVDVGGYRARRAVALQDFARRIASDVAASGQAHSLEPMSAADRKVVHDAVTDIPGAATSSEGDDPRRHVVIRPVPLAGSLVSTDDAGEENSDSE